MEARNISRNFILKKETYEKLVIIAEEKGYKVSQIPVFVTQKCIMPYFKRIDKSRFDAGKLAKEPIPRKIIRYIGSENKKVHTMLTLTEDNALKDVLKYHNFIDKYQRPELSLFLACVIEKMWGDRDEVEEAKPETNKPGKVDLSILDDPFGHDGENWSGEDR